MPLLAPALEVEPGAERVAATGDRDDPGIVVARGILKRLHHAPAELGADRVLDLGPRQPNRPDVSLLLDLNGFAHGDAPKFRRRLVSSTARVREAWRRSQRVLARAACRARARCVGR